MFTKSENDGIQKHVDKFKFHEIQKMIMNSKNVYAKTNMLVKFFLYPDFFAIGE